MAERLRVLWLCTSTILQALVAAIQVSCRRTVLPGATANQAAVMARAQFWIKNKVHHYA